MERDTRQRQAIYNALAKAGRPLAVNELFLLAKSEFGGLGIATVYRNLKILLSENRIRQVDLPGQPPRWELPPEDHHHHFLCRTCNKLFEVYDCPNDLQRLLPKGYTLEEHDILLRGQCNICSGHRS
jgi:Fur family transcriptional regulator, ferric uptake regulator